VEYLQLRALLARERGVVGSADSMHRAVQAVGFRSRRPRYDLSHRPDRAAVAAAKHVLDWLHNNPAVGPERPLLSDSIWSM